jgi:hypothetical protein
MQMSPESEDLDLPKPLADALRDAYTYQPEIPTRIDHSILSTGHAKFAQRRRHRLIVRWGTGVAAGLAAVITLVIILRPTPPAKPIARGDINTDGQVNMVDALALAKHLAANDQPDPAWDINHDGKIDQADVQALASAAVSLNQTGLTQRLPRLQDLGLPKVGLASASRIVDTRESTPLAKASPTKMPQEDAQ